MAKLSIVIKNNNETKTVRVEGLSEQETSKLVREALGLGFLLPTAIRTHPNIEPTIMPLTHNEIISKINESTKNIDIAIKEVAVTVDDFEGVSPVAQAKAYKSKSRKLPLVGSENRSSFSIEDSARTSMQNTKLVEDGLRLFRTYIKCPHCETVHTGRYVNAEQQYLKCFECRQKAKVEPATQNTQIFEGKEIPKMSVDGYYFTAKTEYIEPPVYDNVLEELSGYDGSAIGGTIKHL